MKKVLCITMMALMAMAVARAEDKAPGRWGLGYQGVTVSGGDGDGLDMMNAISVRFAPQPIGGQLLIGQYGHHWENSSDSEEWDTTAWTLQGKFLWTLIDRANSDFYVGGLLGFGYYQDEQSGTPSNETDEWTSVIFGVLTGVEWHFTEIPEIGLNFEVGYNIETENYKNKDGSTYEEDTLFGGTFVSLGATYYF